MKHIFFIHSHITWLVSCAVARHHGLLASEVLLVRSRNYAPPDALFPATDFPVREKHLVPTRHLRRWWRERRKLARFLDAIGTEDFVWYLPHTGFEFFSAFIDHPRCRGFSLIEEGVAAYHTQEQIEAVVAAQPGRAGTNWRTRLARRLGLSRPLVFSDPRHRAVYGCTDQAFPGFERKIRVCIEPPASPNMPAIGAVVVFDAVLEYGLAEEAPFFQCVDELVSRLAHAGHRTVFFKLHPQQYVDTRYAPRLRRILEQNCQGIRFVELPTTFCLEHLATAGEADFFLFCSSVGIYAAEAGCAVFSMGRRLAELDPRYEATFASLPPQVVQRMKLL